MQILFDARGAQVQIQQVTGNRLTTWFDSLTNLGHTCTISDWTQPVGPQLAGVDVYVSLTRQLTSPSNLQVATNFSYMQADIGALQAFLMNGGGVLTFTNHSQSAPTGPYWPLYEIQLAAALGIQLVFASFVPSNADTLTMTASSGASAIIPGVATVQALDSGGIVPGPAGTVLIPLPADCLDMSGLDTDPATCAFAAAYTYGSGRVIVAGHSGIAGNTGTNDPSQGQIGAADNLTFLNDCITYLGS
jgi:hypothetical protein